MAIRHNKENPIMKNRTLALLVTLAAVMVLLLACDSSASKAGADNATKNDGSKLTTQKAEALIKGLLKDNAEVAFEIRKIQPAGMADLWEIRATLQGDDIILYTDSEGKKVLLPPQGIQVYMIEVEGGRVYTAEALSEMGKMDPEKMPLEGAIIYGPREAKNRVVVYDDPF